MGFLVKLDTNGTTPDVLQEFLDNNLVDYVAMDIKTAPDRYIEVTNRAIDGDVIRRSIKVIKSSGVITNFARLL
jgi:pyruvate formate lyase activating enzyme